MFGFYRGFAAGIYTTNSPEACQYCAESSRANIIVVEDEKQLEKILQIKNNLPKLKAIIQYDGVPTVKDVLSVCINKYNIKFNCNSLSVLLMIKYKLILSTLIYIYILYYFYYSGTIY
jgi:long-subunit acyl-CoA synthetase (AMP-forming)